MRAYLIRIGVDQAYGHWNAPMDPETREFVYVPIPQDKPMRPELATPYTLVQPALTKFARAHPGVPHRFVHLPEGLTPQNMHLDPDFQYLTYGDGGKKRGKPLTDFGPGDFIVFYGSYRPVAACEHRLVYAIVGLYRVAEAVRAGTIEPSRWGENAHTRCVDIEPSDVVVRAEAGSSGRLRRCIPIGEYRDRAYRVLHGLLADWGGLSCRDGYIQRSAVLPSLLDPTRFLSWFEGQSAELVASNNP